ncbi:hypothetical protein Bhyg_04879 [Pseudolycoriella hygida]|uniref:Uncharacterized protein n=1 Tax=Pseudolycoriella hygida TaxID=35572 RepID=A0A9Q0NHD0_9DIPT|nr:hypothetical protein Bhyg_04879 [Pseudolycoriella hygida]
MELYVLPLASYRAEIAVGAVSFHQPQQPIQVPSQTPQQHQQPPPHQTYQHQMHPALQHHNPAALHQQLHPAAAAAMFTPLSLRTFINPSANHLSLSQQQQLATAVQQSPNPPLQSQSQTQLGAINLNVGVVPIRQNNGPGTISPGTMMMPVKKVKYMSKKAANAHYQTEDLDKKVSFSVEKIWQSFAKKDDCCGCTCKEIEEWKEGVQEYYTGCRKATWEFRGSSYDLAENVNIPIFYPFGKRDIFREKISYLLQNH